MGIPDATQEGSLLVARLSRHHRRAALARFARHVFQPVVQPQLKVLLPRLDTIYTLVAADFEDAPFVVTHTQHDTHGILTNTTAMPVRVDARTDTQRQL